MVAEETAEDENVIFGLVIDESMGDAVRVTVIATSFQDVRQATGNNRGLSVVDADKRIRKVVNESFHAAPMGRNNGRPTPMGSGFDTLRAEDYDIPTFFRSKD